MQPWEYLTDTVLTRPGMFIGRETYERVCSFVEGFGTARDDGVLDGFRARLGEKTAHGSSPLTWSAALLAEVLPGRDENALHHPEEDARAIAHLQARLVEFLGITGGPGSTYVEHP
ncbi:hypothetical protein [Oerskovia merdavium]|uniref:Uncharacterized protein n=1 Tax=Oerskovia merdavium TaxID=2762227 RepID=A0ABR8TUQ9_9CELL|nr:hypothetical protein [Oerskovia merdavium]MBD7979497.1 hypothetical protein [Oerskovia merdavium]